MSNGLYMHSIQPLGSNHAISMSGRRGGEDDDDDDDDDNDDYDRDDDDDDDDDDESHSPHEKIWSIGIISYMVHWSAYYYYKSFCLLTYAYSILS